MAKKLNKKVAFIGIFILAAGLIGGAAFVYRYLSQRNPERNLEMARQAVAAGDYKQAETFYTYAYRFGKSDKYKIDVLFELADFHLIQNNQHEANWPKALRCWNTVVNIDPKHIEAHRKILDYYYESAAWKNVYDQAAKLIDLLKEKNQPVDTVLLEAYGRASLAIAQTGSTANRAESLNQAMDSFKTLVEREPGKTSHYEYLADAMLLQGEFNVDAGVLDAREKARQAAMAQLDEAVKSADNKAKALATRYNFEIRSLGNDPNRIESLRAELEAHIKATQPDADLLSVLSQAYEIPGKGSPEAELNRAIEAARQAFRLVPDQFEYGYRLVRLLYRKGSAFNDEAAMEDALTLAEEMKLMPQTQPIPGPHEWRNRNYRVTLNIFLSRCYLEKALDNPDQADSWTAKADPLVNLISQDIGSGEHPVVQQWEGILAMAKGDKDRGIRLMYRAYEQAKALDKPGQPSTVDPTLCVFLARAAHENNLRGLEREFLEKALLNQVRIILDKPTLILDYAAIMAQLQAWAPSLNYAQQYQQRYGPDQRSETLIINAALSLGRKDIILERIAALPDQSIDQKALELRWVAAQINRISRDLARTEQTGQTPSVSISKDIENLRKRLKELLFDLAKAAPEKIEASLMQSACVYYLQNDQKTDAAALLDAYLAKQTENLPLQILRRQINEPDPMSVPAERYEAIQLEAIDGLSDPKQKTLVKADFYRVKGQYDKAVEILEQAAQNDKINENEYLRQQFQTVLDQQDLAAAEALLPVIRTRNLDDCEGNLAGAQVEQLKENYAVALRRVDECLAARPLFSYGYFLKSRIQLAMNSLDAAVESSRQSIQMEPLNSLYAKNHVSLLSRRNAALGSRVTDEQQNELFRALTTAMILNPNDWELQNIYAEAISRSNPDQALALRQQILKSQPTVANAIMLGNMAMRMAENESDIVKKSGLVELAGRAYARGREIDPEDISAKAAHADFLNKTDHSKDAEILLQSDKNLLWRFYLQNGQFDKANEVLNALHKADPEDRTVLQGLAETAKAQGKRDELKKYLDNLAARENNKTDDLWLLQEYLDGGFAEEGAQLLANFKEKYPEEKLILLMEAWSKMKNGQLAEALDLTNQYLEHDTENAAAWRLRGSLHRLMNEPRKAIDDLQRSKSLAPNFAVSRELAAVFMEMGQVDIAIGEIKSSLSNPKAPMEMRLMLETIYQRNNRLSDLERFYTEQLENAPNSAFWSVRAGQFYLSRNDAAKAVSYLKRAWETLRQQGVSDPVTLNLCLEALNQSRQFDTVLAAATELIDTPLAPIAYAQMAQAYFLQNQLQKAESFFAAALDKSGPSDMFQETVLTLMLKTVGREPADRWVQNAPDALPNLLLGYRLAQRNEQFNRGIELIDKCLAGTTSDKPEWGAFAMKKANLLVQAYMKTADKSYMNRAIDQFEQVLDRYPENPSVLNNLSYLLAVNDQRIDRALQYALRAHQQDPGNPIYLDTYAYAQYKNGQHQEARQNLLRAIQLFEANRLPVTWDVYNHLGMVYESLGETAQALDSFQKALNAASDTPEEERKTIEKQINQLKNQG